MTAVLDFFSADSCPWRPEPENDRSRRLFGVRQNPWNLVQVKKQCFCFLRVKIWNSTSAISKSTLDFLKSSRNQYHQNLFRIFALRAEIDCFGKLERMFLSVMFFGVCVFKIHINIVKIHIRIVAKYYYFNIKNNILLILKLWY